MIALVELRWLINKVHSNPIRQLLQQGSWDSQLLHGNEIELEAREADPGANNRWLGARR